MTVCSTLARTSGEPLAATAPHVRTWVALEQPGPWGRKALLDSHLDHALGRELTARTAGVPVTVVLIRRPGPHPDQHERFPRRLWVAHTGPDAEPWLQHAVIDDPAVLLDLDVAALAAGERPALGEPDTVPLLLVCTNARRDACCAVLGRPAVGTLAGRHPGRVWESSHLGGHRFAPTVLSLPDGFLYGGPDAPSLTLAACRGRTALPRPAQAAELAVLAAAGVDRPHALAVLGDGEQWRVLGPDGPVDVAVTPSALPPRRESCTGEEVGGTSYTAVLGAVSAAPWPRPRTS